MAIIYSYPTVTPTSDDLVLGTDVNGEGKPTKNFTIQSIVDIVQGGATGLGAVLTISSDALQQPATNFTNVQGTGTSTFGSFTDGTMTISNGVGTGFTAFTSTAITGTLQTAAQPNITSLGNLTGLVINGAVSGTNVITSTTLAGASNTNIASTLAIKTYVDSNPSGAESLAATLLIGNITSGRDIAVSAGDDITFTNTSKILMGTTAVDNLEIYSDSANSIVIDRSPGALKLQTSLLSVRNEADTTQTISASAAGAVELYHGGTKKFETTSSGVKTDGIVENPAGTSGAPTFTFTGDTNTGMYRSGAGFVAFSSNGNITARISESDFESESTDFTVNGVFRALTTAQASFGGKLTVATPTASSDAATKGYVDLNNAGQTLDYAGDATGPFALNLSTDDLEFNGDTNITVTAATVAANKGIVTIDLNNDVGISGTMTAGTFTDGTFSGTAGTYTGGVSITSSTFTATNTPIGFIGNASTATALASPGTIQLLSGSGATQGVASNAVTYTSGGDIQLTTTLADTTVTAKALTGLPTFTSSAIDANDTILAALAKLQGQITSTTGLAYEGTWDPGTSATGGGTPDLRLADAKVNGHFYICSAAGSGTPNGDGTTPNSWLTGDWVIYVANGSATDSWQKLDQTNEVLGSGAATKIAKWTSGNTLGTGLISDDGATVTIGTNGNLVVQGDTTLGDNAALDTVTLNGPTTFESTGRFKKGIALGTATDGSEYGASNQVLTASTSAGSPPTWETPTTGTVTSVSATTAGDALDVAVTNPTTTPAIALTWAGGASGATKYVNGLGNLITFPTVDNYVSWTADSDEGTDIAVTSGFNLKFTGAVTAGGAGIATDSTVSANEMTIGLINAGGTPGATTFYRGDGQWSVPVGTKTETLAEVLVNGNASGANDIVMADSQKVTFGSEPDLQLYHDTSNSYIETTGASAGDLYIKSQGTGHDLYLQATDDVLIRPQGGNNGIKVIGQASVELYYNNTKRFETTSTGVEVINTDVNVPAALTLSQDSKTFTITNGLTGNPTLQTTGGSFNFRTDSNFIFKKQSNSQTYATIGGTQTFSVNNSAGNNVVNALQLIPSTDATALGTKTRVYGDLQVDGNIIHGGGGGGIFNGDQAIDAAGTDTLAFTLTRAATGTLIFDVFLTSETANNSSQAMKFSVAHSYNTAPVFNKVIDTGLDGTTGFTVEFKNSNTGATGTSVICEIASAGGFAQNIGYTIQVGHDSTNALTFTPAS